MIIVRTTDNRHLGRDIPVLNRGDTLNLDDFVFVVMQVKTLKNGNTLLSNFNYQIECEAI